MSFVSSDFLLIDSASHQKIMALAKTLFTSRYHLTYELINRCCVDLAIEVLDQIARADDYFALQTFPEQTAYQYRTILDILHEEGLVSLSSSQTQWRKLPSKRWVQADCRHLCRQGTEQFSESQSMFDLIALCREGMVSFLTGHRSGVDVLFPKGDGSIWYRYNNENALLSVYAQLVAAAVDSYARQDSPLNILEVGSGTGAGTAAIVTAVGERIGSYLYSDLGSTFLRQGRERFGNLPYINYKKLDINIPLVEQGITPGSVDVVVGVNAVHTARNLECTLCSLKQVIRPGGWLFIGEGSPPFLVSRWKPDIIFGLLDGWWNVNVTPTRPRAGFLTPSEWCKLLTNAGFEFVHALPGQNFFKPGPCYGGVVIGISPTEN